MASLSTLLSERLSPFSQETNLEQGQLFVFHPAVQNSSFRCCFCWTAPASGTAIIEIWGASGSGGRMCCCGTGIPGNPGAYSKRTVSVNSGSHVTGDIGMSCGNSSLCWRGCSQSTCVTVCHSGGCNCMCAQGGNGGWAFCADGGSISCCLTANYGMCFTRLNSGCFIVCNLPYMGVAYGGDVNCCGGISCTSFFHCNPCCHCSFYDHVAVSPGIFGTDGAVLTIGREVSTDYQNGTGAGVHQLIGALAATGRSPVLGHPNTSCWAGSNACGCYESWGCVPMLPYGVPGPTSYACQSVRDNGARGGHGAVRIKFIGS